MLEKGNHGPQALNLRLLDERGNEQAKCEFNISPLEVGEVNGAQFPASVRRQDTTEDVDGICGFSGALSPPLSSHYGLILGGKL